MAAQAVNTGQLFTIESSLILCGVSQRPGLSAVGLRSDANRMAEEIFHNQFESCKDMSYKDITDDFETYAALSEKNGKIKLPVGTKKKIRAFLQWVKDEYHYGRNPEETAFPVADTEALIRRSKTFALFVSKSENLSKAAEPEKLKITTEWNDWKPTFENYLRLIPGRDGTPLSYIIRTNDQPDPTPHNEFLDEYVKMAPLTGEAFGIDSFEVRTYIMKYIAGNSNAEAAIQALQDTRCGRAAFLALSELYEGVGVNAIDITKADSILSNLFYHGEKQPHMWWAEFEKRLTWAFGVYNKRERREVFSDEYKFAKIVLL